MYEVDSRDSVVDLSNVPKSDVGAPLPLVVSDEHFTILAYIVSEPDPNWDGTYATMVGPETADRKVAVIKFSHPYAKMFGPPNDEAFTGHPLAGRGLQPYGVFEILNSSWIRKLERMNSVHRYHNRERFMENLHHFIFAFHDSTFECIAEGLEFQISRGSMRSVLKDIAEQLQQQ